MFLSLTLGADSLIAHWRAENSVLNGRSAQVGLATHVQLGVPLTSLVSLSLIGGTTIPVIPPLHGLVIGEVGVAGDWFSGSEDAWRVHVAAQRAWAGIAAYLNASIGHTPPPLNEIDDIWLFEMGAGYARRHGRWDRNWMLSAFGGPLWVGTDEGWIVGLGLSFSWSRS